MNEKVVALILFCGFHYRAFVLHILEIIIIRNNRGISAS